MRNRIWHEPSQTPLYVLDSPYPPSHTVIGPSPAALEATALFSNVVEEDFCELRLLKILGRLAMRKSAPEGILTLSRVVWDTESEEVERCLHGQCRRGVSDDVRNTRRSRVVNRRNVRKESP